MFTIMVFFHSSIVGQVSTSSGSLVYFIMLFFVVCLLHSYVYVDFILVVFHMFHYVSSVSHVWVFAVLLGCSPGRVGSLRVTPAHRRWDGVIATRLCPMVKGVVRACTSYYCYRCASSSLLCIFFFVAVFVLAFVDAFLV